MKKKQRNDRLILLRIKETKVEGENLMTKKIIVTGCNGQLGRAVNQFYAGRDDVSFVNTDVDELDISNVDAVSQ